VICRNAKKTFVKQRISTMKAKVDENACIGCGLCEATCPEVFRMNDSDIAEVIANPVPSEAEETCREAAEGCPVDAIALEE
jgi:ferredoxin